MQKIDVRVLIEKHNHHKGYKPIPFDTLWRMFKDSLKHIEKVYSPMVWNTGIMDTTEYRQAWDRLNDIQLDCIKGRASLGDYQNTLKEWQRVVKELSNGNNDKNFYIQPIQ